MVTPPMFRKASLAARPWGMIAAGEAVLLHELVSSIASGRCLRNQRGESVSEPSLPTLPKFNMGPKDDGFEVLLRTVDGWKKL